MCAVLQLGRKASENRVSWKVDFSSSQFLLFALYFVGQYERKTSRDEILLLLIAAMLMLVPASDKEKKCSFAMCAARSVGSDQTSSFVVD